MAKSPPAHSGDVRDAGSTSWVGKIPLEQEMAIPFLSSVFILFWLLWAPLLPAGLSLSCGEWGLVSSCGVQASHCAGFSCRRAPALDTWVSVVAASGLQRASL